MFSSFISKFFYFAKAEREVPNICPVCNKDFNYYIKIREIRRETSRHLTKLVKEFFKFVLMFFKIRQGEFSLSSRRIFNLSLIYQLTFFQRKESGIKVRNQRCKSSS